MHRTLAMQARHTASRLAARLPSQCAVCGGWGHGVVCHDCMRRHAGARPRCVRCAIALPLQAIASAAASAPGTHCADCLREPPPYGHAVAAVDYAHPWSRLIGAFKFRAAVDLATPLAALLVDAVRRHGPVSADLIVPVPLSPERLAERGLNQAWELARRVGATLGVASRADRLLRRIDTAHLAALPRAERRARIRGAFGVPVGAALHGRHVALVDDVMTSGATAAEAGRTLSAAGAASVQVWVVARTPAPSDR